MTLGLLRSFKRLGLNVASAKSGPDYIDPAFHAAATGRDCVTLDGWAMDPDALRKRASDLNVNPVVVEGAMGLFDGPAALDTDTAVVCGSTAHVAEALGLPVVLVLDVRRMGQTAGAIIAGLNAWSDGVSIAGVILNRVASPRHLTMLRTAVERICPVLGVLPDDARLAMPSRHLGLVQASETQELERFLEGAADAIGDGCDLNTILRLAAPLRDGHTSHGLRPPGQRIAVASDVAFAFCYPHVLMDWQADGAELSFFSPLLDEAPQAECDAVYLPGGYPELHANVLSSNDNFFSGLRGAAQRGARVYGECGGFMVLGNALIDDVGTAHKMAGLLQLETTFATRQRHLGYRTLSPLADHWLLAQGKLAAHEFHYSTILRAEGKPLFQAKDAAGTELPEMGLVEGNVMGSYAHIIAPSPGA